jgi:putative SOS response-associated peptidase YedK
MCGRYFLDMDFERIVQFYDFLENQDKIDYTVGEIFPSQEILVLSASKVSTMHWGMNYSFMKQLLINARSETVSEKRLFKEAIFNRRVILPANYYFEWEKSSEDSVKHAIALSDEPVMSLAGIYNPV